MSHFDIGTAVVVNRQRAGIINKYCSPHGEIWLWLLFEDGRMEHIKPMALNQEWY